MDSGSTNVYAGKLKNSLYWWLGFRRAFVVNDEYSIELLHIDRYNNSVKIRVTNLKTSEVVENEVSND